MDIAGNLLYSWAQLRRRPHFLLLGLSFAWMGAFFQAVGRLFFFPYVEQLVKQSVNPGESEGFGALPSRMLIDFLLGQEIGWVMATFFLLACFLILIGYWMIFLIAEGGIIQTAVEDQQDKGLGFAWDSGIGRMRKLMNVDAIAFIPLTIYLFFLALFFLAAFVYMVGSFSNTTDQMGMMSSIFVIYGVLCIGGCFSLPLGYLTMIWRTVAFRIGALQGELSAWVVAKESFLFIKKEFVAIFVASVVIATLHSLFNVGVLFLIQIITFFSASTVMELVGNHPISFGQKVMLFIVGMIVWAVYTVSSGFFFALKAVYWTRVYQQLRVENE